MSQSPEYTYTCSLCGKPAMLKNGEVLHQCEHTKEAVIAKMKATAYGESKVK